MKIKVDDGPGDHWTHQPCRGDPVWYEWVLPSTLILAVKKFMMLETNMMMFIIQHIKRYVMCHHYNNHHWKTNKFTAVLKQTVEGLVQQNRLTETQVSELMWVASFVSCLFGGLLPFLFFSLFIFTTWPRNKYPNVHVCSCVVYSPWHIFFVCSKL